jgi:chromosomal replication initiation ATPase DnaA
VLPPVISRKADQLAFDLPHRAATGRDDFLVSAANEAAVAAVDAWPNWPNPVLVLAGEPGSGKSHLADVWRARSGARLVDASQLSRDAVPALLETHAVVVEDAPGSALDEVALFHLINLARETGGSILMTARKLPAQWNVSLPDLRSRLNAAQVVALGDPDDALLRGVLVKLFADRQLAVGEAVISYMVTRMERSFEAARLLVAAIDARALEERAEITRGLVARVMQEEFEPDLFGDD